MDGVVVAFQHVEAARQPLVGGAENREIMQILDLVVDAELLQQELQPRHKLAREFGRRQRAVAELRLDGADHGGQLAKHVVARQPEARHLAQIGVALPLLARETRDQHAQLLRPAAAARQREVFEVGGAGRFNAHGS